MRSTLPGEPTPEVREQIAALKKDPRLAPLVNLIKERLEVQREENDVNVDDERLWGQGRAQELRFLKDLLDDDL